MLCLVVNAGGKVLNEEPRSNNFLRILALEYAYGGTLGDYLGVCGIDLGGVAIPTVKGYSPLSLAVGH